MGSVLSSVHQLFSSSKYPSSDAGAVAVDLPVHRAARENDWETLRQLLTQEAWWDGANAANQRDETPLHLAAAKGHVECALLLVDYGADSTLRDRAGMTPLHHAVGHGHRPILDLVTRAHGYSSLNMKDNWGWTPLHRAIINFHYQTAYVLLEAGCSVNDGDRTGRTPLHVAASYGHIRIASLLITKGADVDSSDRRGWTPLMLAVVGGHLQVVRDLIHAGCQVNTKNDERQTALLLCCKGMTVAKHCCALELVGAGAVCSEVEAVLEDFLTRLSRQSTETEEGSREHQGESNELVVSRPADSSKQLIVLLVKAAGSLPASLASRAIWWYENKRDFFDRSSLQILHLMATSATLSMLKSATRTFLLEGRVRGKVKQRCPSLKDICRCFSRQHLSTIHGNVMCAVDKVHWLPHGLRELLVMNDVRS